MGWGVHTWGCPRQSGGSDRWPRAAPHRARLWRVGTGVVVWSAVWVCPGRCVSIWVRVWVWVWVCRGLRYNRLWVRRRFLGAWWVLCVLQLRGCLGLCFLCWLLSRYCSCPPRRIDPCKTEAAYTCGSTKATPTSACSLASLILRMESAEGKGPEAQSEIKMRGY